MKKQVGTAKKARKISTPELKASILSNLVALDSLTKECREVERQMHALQERKNTIEEAWRKHNQKAKDLHKEFMKATGHSEYNTGVYELGDGRIATISSHGSGIDFNTLTPLVK